MVMERDILRYGSTVFARQLKTIVNVREFTFSGINNLADCDDEGLRVSASGNNRGESFNENKEQ